MDVRGRRLGKGKSWGKVEVDLGGWGRSYCLLGMGEVYLKVDWGK